MKKKKATAQKAHAPVRILAIGAHPDDVELCCAGTLARCIERGDQVTIAIACIGDSASMDRGPEEIAKIRNREASNAARLLGADLIQMGLSDYGLDVNMQTKQLFADAIRQAAPDLIL